MIHSIYYPNYAVSTYSRVKKINRVFDEIVERNL